MHPARRRLLALIAAVLVGCGATESPSPSPGEPPWDEPVDGAVAVTAWEDHGQPTAPFGAGGVGWRSPDDLIADMAAALATTGDVRTSGRVVERRADGTVVGWVRISLPEPDGAVLAGDMRVEMRNDGGSWLATRTDLREHCARPLVDGECR